LSQDKSAATISASIVSVGVFLALATTALIWFTRDTITREKWKRKILERKEAASAKFSGFVSTTLDRVRPRKPIEPAPQTRKQDSVEVAQRYASVIINPDPEPQPNVHLPDEIDVVDAYANDRRMTQFTMLPESSEVFTEPHRMTMEPEVDTASLRMTKMTMQTYLDVDNVRMTTMTTLTDASNHRMTTQSEFEDAYGSRLLPMLQIAISQHNESVYEPYATEARSRSPRKSIQLETNSVYSAANDAQ
jgi:hypothetical protein